ncbi:MAG: hypothetical protein UW46_C0002G0022 [Candidatus Yanofskybacteria bacterium GW2011_GWF1_44_227]|uniref:Uncharacterized protein n=1 Tax=Candidatus Yanofskybacteria bacterium GW2011_GWE2_40_11 TaxID=1619033 RepID=A0A0G0QKN8_9BACT|nr:MAG: hypothetical protein UT69_C0017G0017 [Candidatus Yanofskybacteria bacterium GW2011_GWE1_40_10]KKR40663.1 MAG: hypothetical protein UT75_C0006G0042 [Candidatus Yanofskybacteria bacterium GW2011_GWE2_40_11]KKT15776.1 MAG: hypothetical protein UV97_C0002G0022 [Candidatus Yanofskybacteria bacterium GW2011_GWF2_43_596]KKT53466.1 MAG: hypothetical protein UW46_C0002G0022 [Candidatus Yanofskybacteria bacterium GW2011_GWF1_44_227]OGN35875.1 MAG: hypothetical protein A2241_03790 [Candidatus Yano
MSIKYKRSQGGFTIIESLVALAVLGVALGPMLAMASMASNVSAAVKNNLTGAMLAQEGVEVVRALRDANWLNSVEFDQGLVGTWILQSDTNLANKSPEPINIDEDNQYLRFNAETGLYNYDSGTDTIFRRKITITKNPTNEDEMIVVCEVTYKNRSSDKVIRIEDHLYDWK